jgi:uncharacterized LabA/DUF88 family protein
MNKLIFFLDRNFLEIYKDSVQLGNIVYECRSTSKPLNLSSEFEQVWKNIYNEFILDTKEFEIVIANSAGFTDTRMIAVWCRSEVMFDSSKSLKIIKNGEVLEEIQYSHKPKIGVSK